MKEGRLAPLFILKKRPALSQPTALAVRMKKPHHPVYSARRDKKRSRRADAATAAVDFDGKTMVCFQAKD